MKTFSITFVISLFCLMSFGGDNSIKKASLVEGKLAKELVLDTGEKAYHYCCTHSSHMNCDGPLTSSCGCSESPSYALLSTCEAEAKIHNQDYGEGHVAKCW